MLIILSDFLDPGGFEEGLKFVNRKKCDVVVVQVLDQSELIPDMKGHLNLVDIESGETKKIVLNSNLIKRYQKKMSERLKALSDFCIENGVTYYLADTRRSFEEFLIEFLSNQTLAV